MEEGLRATCVGTEMTGQRTGYAPPPRQVDKVLEAALRLFDDFGYSAATIEDIRLQSDVSIGSIYHHFGSKEGIAGALYSESLRSFQQGLLGALRATRDAETGVRSAVGHHLSWVDANPARARFLLRRRETEVVRLNKPRVRGLNRLLFAEIEQWHRPLAESGDLRDMPLPLLLAIWFGPAQEYARQALERPQPPTLLDAEPALADAAWAALRP